MMVRLARIYVLALFGVELLLFTAALLLHVSACVGTRQLPLEIGSALFAGSLYVNFMSAALAKERDVWRNEFKSCPAWVRLASLAFGIYGLLFVLWRVVLFPQEGSSENLLTLSALPLSFNALFLCIPYAILWTSAIEPPELVNRVRTSFIPAVIGLVIYLLHRAGHHPQTNR